MTMEQTQLKAATARPARATNDLARRIRQSRIAWAYIAPAGLLMLFVTLFPYIYQVGMAFTNYRIQNLRFNIFAPDTWERFAPAWVGLDNFRRILTSQLTVENYDFGRLLLFNVTWTVTNVALHVSLGVVIALALNQKDLIGRKVYRALFILPWAIPGYITALTWKNMYDQRFGAVNHLLRAANGFLGTDLPTNVRWLEQAQPPIGGPLAFLPLAYYALLLTNVWLGWPFMTVVATGALQAIPNDLYEAANMDGANAWQKFWHVTVPLIRPAMVPAIMLGTIWTFNNFAVIYFISEGGPFGRTEILVTQAFKLVYEQRLYGVAAAFGIVIFVILLVFTIANNRITRATEAYDV